MSALSLREHVHGSLIAAVLALHDGRIQGVTTVTPFNNVIRPAGAGPYACPCCGYLTLRTRGGFEICAVCFWEDDGQGDHDSAQVRGGPNGFLSLDQARRNFTRYGACSPEMVRHVRPALAEEYPLR
ncbi:CPCC family cysteine-rich protein [Amycolatopsis cynarae]|uniref:CPCC family cysteine-rich protein n=1 Tax=Amycolatopsis cynarae TaxID=2995223 RepID=UPI003898DB12